VGIEPIVAPGIAYGPVPHVVTYTINLDRKPSDRAIEIKHVRTYRMLPAKYRLPLLAPTKAAPQLGFGW
jgi:hypothetical protein